MNVLGIMGSPRIGGNSDLLLDRALAGAGEAGAAVEKIILTADPMVHSFKTTADFTKLRSGCFLLGFPDLERSVDDDGEARADTRRGTDLDPEAVSFENRQFTFFILWLKGR